MVSGNATKFANEISVCTHVYIDKIRCTYSGSDLFIDVHYNTANSNIVKVGVTAYGKASDNNVTTPSNLVGVNDAPSGETIVTEYTLSATKARGKHTLWSGYTQTDVALTDNMYNYDELLLTAVTNVDCYCFAISPSAFFGNNWVCSASAGPVEGGFTYNSSIGVAPANSGNGLAISVSSNNPNWTLHLLKVEGIIA
jgi:hypothetical protein